MPHTIEIKSLPDSKDHFLPRFVRGFMRICFYFLTVTGFYGAILNGDYWYRTSRVELSMLTGMFILPCAGALIIRGGEYLYFKIRAASMSGESGN